VTLKAVLLDLNGTLIHDEPIHRQLLLALLAEKGIVLEPGEYATHCLGRSDRACLQGIWQRRGQTLDLPQQEALIAIKNQRYRETLAQLPHLPLYPDAADFLFRLRGEQVRLALVTGAFRAEAQWILEQSHWLPYFSAVVTGDDITHSKPDPEGYCLAIDRLNQAHPDLGLLPWECLAVEDSPAGMQAAQGAGIPVVGVAHTLPFHMVQRRADWAIDRLIDLELPRVKATFADALRD
jgi:beta-phosphoglucomutase